MDNRMMIAAAGAAVLLGAAALFVVTSGGGDEPTKPAPAALPASTAKPAPSGGADATPDAAPAPREPGAKVKVNEDVVHDEAYEERAKAARDRRQATNNEWRAQTTTAAQQWVASSGLDEAKGVEVMGAITRTHDLIAQSRLDFEDGVLDRVTFREELAGAKEDMRVELENLLGAEKKDELLTAMASGKLGGF